MKTQKGRVLKKSQYSRLLKDIQILIKTQKAEALKRANQVLVETYWQVGKRIAKEKLTENAGYGDTMIQRLAEDLGMALDTLRRAILFFRTYSKKAPRGFNLSWSHYREIMRLPTKQERSWYELLAHEEGLKRDDLLRLIQQDAYRNQTQGRRSRVQKIRRPREASFVYKAAVKRVVDGDTLLLKLDLGFQVSKEQRVRLAEVDAEGPETDKGQAAMDFVLETLAGVPFVVVKTNKIDVYGRYVGHVFYSPVSADLDTVFVKGRYLNQDLLDRKLAKRL